MNKEEGCRNLFTKKRAQKGKPQQGKGGKVLPCGINTTEPGGRKKKNSLKDPSTSASRSKFMLGVNAAVMPSKHREKKQGVRCEKRRGHL